MKSPAPTDGWGQKQESDCAWASSPEYDKNESDKADDDPSKDEPHAPFPRLAETEEEPIMADTRKLARSTTKSSSVLTAEERAAMKETIGERKRRPAGTADGEADVLAKIAERPPSDRAMAERLHTIIKATAPGLAPRTWYGMPAYAKDGDVLLFFQSANKFKACYATLGFSDKANLDDGEMWSTSFALKILTAAGEAKIAKLVKQAVI